MSEIESPLGKKSFPTTTTKRVFTVTDDTQDDNAPLPQSIEFQNNPGRQEVRLTPEQFNELQARRKEAQSNQRKPTSEARQRVEILTGIGRLTKEVVIEEYKFTLQSLKSREMREIIKIVSQVAVPSEAMYEMRAQTLARSLVKIDDRPVGLVLGAATLEDIVEFINESEEHIVNQLFVAYNDMVKMHDAKFAVKNEQDAKEVAEEIKKS